MSYITIDLNVFVSLELTRSISFEFGGRTGNFGGLKKCCGNGWGWKSNTAGTDGDGNHV